MAAGDQVRGLAPTIKGDNSVVAGVPGTGMHLQWRSLAAAANDPWVSIGVGRVNATFSDFIPTFGASQLLLGVSYLNVAAGPNVAIFLQLADDDGGSPNVDFPDCSLFPIAVAGGVQRFNVNVNEYGPIATSTNRSIVLPICAHGFRVGLFADAATVAGMVIFAYVERLYATSASTPPVI